MTGTVSACSNNSGGKDNDGEREDPGRNSGADLDGDGDIDKSQTDASTREGKTTTGTMSSQAGRSNDAR